jgi:hypothetical protein
MKKEVFYKSYVSCKYYPVNGVEPSHCEGCSFFDGVTKRDEDGKVVEINCLRDNIPSISGHYRTTEMVDCTDHVYRVRRYDPDIDGELKGDPYDYCQKCCFNHKLSNGKECCLLRVQDDELSNFLFCFDGEIWTKEKRK